MGFVSLILVLVLSKAVKCLRFVAHRILSSPVGEFVNECDDIF